MKVRRSDVTRKGRYLCDTHVHRQSTFPHSTSTKPFTLHIKLATMYSPSFNGNPMHSPSMMTSTVSQKRFFSPEHQAWPPSSPMQQQQQQQQRQDFNTNSSHLPEERDNTLRPSQVGTTIQSHLSPRNRQYGLSALGGGFNSSRQYPHGDAGKLQGVCNG